MRITVLYRPDSEHGRIVDEFIHELRRRIAEVRIDVLNVDSRDGIAIASLYDIMEYPAVLVMANDGLLLKSWVGSQLPMLDEISSYAIQ